MTTNERAARHLFVAVLTINTALWGADAVYRFRIAPAIVRAREAHLRHDLRTMRKMIDRYTVDRQRAPRSLDDLVGAGYLADVPMDPMTGSRTSWATIIEDDPVAVRGERGIVDVKSGSDSIDAAGQQRYSDW
jgi:general secretion pathway protein G